MRLELAAVRREAPEGGYTAFVKELPAAIRGETLEGARANPRGRLRLLIEMSRSGGRAHREHNPKEVSMSVHLHLTAVFQKVPLGYIAWAEELPGANTQGATLEEARENLEEAVLMVLEANRTLAEEELAGAEVIREPLLFNAA